MTIFKTDTIMQVNSKMAMEANLLATWVSKKARKLTQKAELLADQ